MHSKRTCSGFLGNIRVPCIVPYSWRVFGTPAVLITTGSLYSEQQHQLETIASDSCLSAGTIALLMGCGGGERAPFVWEYRHGRWLIGHDKPLGTGGRKRSSAGIINSWATMLNETRRKKFSIKAVDLNFFFAAWPYVIRERGWETRTTIHTSANVTRISLTEGKSYYYMEKRGKA